MNLVLALGCVVAIFWLMGQAVLAWARRSDDIEALLKIGGIIILIIALSIFESWLIGGGSDSGYCGSGAASWEC